MAVRTPWDPVTGDVMTEARLDTLPRGWLGYVEVTSGQTVSTGTETDLTGLSVTVTVGTNRRIRVTAHGLFNRTVADGVSVARIKEGSTELGRFSQHSPSAATEFDLGEGSAILTPSAGSHTYKCTLQRVTGTGNAVMSAAAGSPAWLLVEDLGDV
jgi:hypothetical protein